MWVWQLLLMILTSTFQEWKNVMRQDLERKAWSRDPVNSWVTCVRHHTKWLVNISKLQNWSYQECFSSLSEGLLLTRFPSKPGIFSCKLLQWMSYDRVVLHEPSEEVGKSQQTSNRCPWSWCRPLLHSLKFVGSGEFLVSTRPNNFTTSSANSYLESLQ